VKAKKHTVVQGTDNAFTWAKNYHVKLAWGTDFLFNPAQNKNQNTDILELKAWFSPAETLELVTHDNAPLLALSGSRNPYPGKLGVVEVDAFADLLLVDGDPIAVDFHPWTHVGLGAQYKFNRFSYAQGIRSAALGGHLTYQGVQFYASFLS
jgi:imidazolonepropionase-like amidohydrolase